MVTNHLEDLVTTAKFYEAKGKEQRAKGRLRVKYLDGLSACFNRDKKNTGLIRDSTDQVNNES